MALADFELKAGRRYRASVDVHVPGGAIITFYSEISVNRQGRIQSRSDSTPEWKSFPLSGPELMVTSVAEVPRAGMLERVRRAFLKSKSPDEPLSDPILAVRSRMNRVSVGV